MGERHVRQERQATAAAMGKGPGALAPNPLPPLPLLPHLPPCRPYRYASFGVNPMIWIPAPFATSIAWITS